MRTIVNLSFHIPCDLGHQNPSHDHFSHAAGVPIRARDAIRDPPDGASHGSSHERHSRECIQPLVRVYACGSVGNPHDAMGES